MVPAPEIVGTLEIVPAPAEMTATIGIPERSGMLKTTEPLAKHKQQHWFQKQVGTLAVPAIAEMTATAGMQKEQERQQQWGRKQK